MSGPTRENVPADRGIGRLYGLKIGQPCQQGVSRAEPCTQY